GVFDYDPNGAVFSGATDSFTYATYSDSVLVDQISLDDMDASQGFTMWGPEVGGLTGQSVSVVGDVNGDGYADVMIGAPYADTTDMAGDAYLVYGSADGPGTDIALSDLDGTHGVRLTGMSVSERFGIAVAGLGDINGDGYDDFAVGATYGDFDDGSSSRTSGEMYVVFGKNGSFGSEFDVTTLDGTDGFAVHSLTGGNALGVSAASAGDLNGDGLDDILIGAPRAASRDGLAYVIYGQETAYSADIDPNALDGAQGFVISGADDDGVIGASVAALGDVNGDGLNDFVVGAAHADVDGQNKAGAAYVVFGNGLGFDDVNLADLDGSNGFRLTGGHAEDRAGQAVSSAGDINGDGLMDFAIGSPFNDARQPDGGRIAIYFGGE
ncbi:MAG: integrin alpha, partial [Paracoccaceae bacterium]